MTVLLSLVVIKILAFTIKVGRILDYLWRIFTLYHFVSKACRAPFFDLLQLTNLCKKLPWKNYQNGLESRILADE